MEIKEIKEKRNDIIFRNTVWVTAARKHFTFFRNIVELNALKNFEINHSDAVLDVGAGVGRVTREFSKSGAEIIAMDYSVESLKVNKLNSSVQVVAADMCCLPFKSSIFDKVVAISVLQYVSTHDSRLKALKEIRRVLKPRSMLLLQTYNYRPVYDGLVGRRDGFHRGIPPVRYHRFDLNELRYLLFSLFEKVKLQAILTLNPLMQGSLGNITILAKFAALLEELISKSRFSFFFADHLVATCKKP